VLAIIGSVALAYYPSLHYDFQFDDLANITKHFNIRHATFYQLFFSGTRWISYWLNTFFYSVSLFQPYAYRVGSVVIHSINSVLVFCLFSLILENLNGTFSFFRAYRAVIAVTTALLFALHPVQTQTISYVIQSQLEGLATMSILSLAILLLLYYHVHSKLTRIGLVIAIGIIAALCTGTKEIAIIAPVLLLLVDYFFISQGSIKALKRHWAVHCLVTSIIIGVYLYLLKPSFFMKAFGLQMESRNNIGNVITSSPQGIITPLHYFISQFKVIVHYFLIFIWPSSISVEYDWKMVESFSAPDCCIPFLALVMLGIGLGLLVRRHGMHPVAFGILWFLIVLAPRSTIIPSPELIVDYKTYMGSPGLLFVLAAGLVYALVCIGEIFQASRFSRVLPWMAPLLVIIICVPLVRARNKVWSSGTEFWMNIILNAPGKARAYNNYGVELAQNLGRFEDAIPYYQKAIAMDNKYPDPCNNLAVSYATLNRIDDAIYAIKQGLAIYAYYPEGYNNLASFYLQKKDYPSAEKALKIAIQLRPYYGKAHYNLGRLYLETGETERAFDCFKTCCCAGDLDNEVGFEAYAQVSTMCKKYDDAIGAYKKLLVFQPHSKEYAFGLANIYHAQCDYPKAHELYAKLMNAYPQEARFVYNLAESYFAAGNYKDAQPLFQKIVQLGNCPAQAVIRLAGCHEGLGRPDISYGMLKELTAKVSAQDKEVIAVAQERMRAVYGDRIVA
jgi:tetratricopeptide (TPR) repeat protein